ncbi:MAG: PEP-CTERM sorting domain-containing protein [Heteroscytonema crispum UTEX LB 1556]
MKKYQQSIKQFLLLVTPFLASSVLAISPSRAATFAGSEGTFELTNFSQSPSSVSAETFADTLGISKGGTVTALAQSEAFFLQVPPQGFNSSLSLAFGENGNYLAQAESEATLIGIFDIKADTDFSFNFAGNLELLTSIDNPPGEKARASGDISFALFDIENNSALDFFSLAGNLTSEDDNDFIAYQKSENVTLSNLVSDSSFGGNQEFAIASADGFVKRYFTNNTSLALIEVKRNQVRVSAPEPSTVLALFFSCGVIGVALKRKRNSSEA